MNKIIGLALVLVLSLHVFTPNVMAAVTEDEVSTVIAEKGITRERLQEMLDYYEMKLDDFANAAELSEFIGTPITEESVSLLLDQYGMTREELDALLEEFGMTVEEHFSIEELDLTIDFALNHDTMLEDLEQFLSAIGLTEEESERLFAHFESLDELQLEAKMEEVGARLEELMMLDPEAELTDEQKQELENLWGEMMSAFDLQAKFYQVNTNGEKTPISFAALTEMTDFTGMSLMVELYNNAGELLMDVQLSEEMLTGDFVLNAAEKVTDIADLAGELTNLRHNALPDTASHYMMYTILGVMIIVLGVGILYNTRKKKKIYLIK
jgi:processed acidic surface protein